MQKAIRRGNADFATRYAALLHSVDPAYCWRRLQIVALEDVGFGDPLSAAITLEAGHSHRFRQKLGERPVLAAVSQSLADATKSRLITDLLVRAGSPTPIPPSDLIAANTKPHEASFSAPWLVHYLARRNTAGLGKYVLPAWRLIEDRNLSTREDVDRLGDSLIDGFLAASYDVYVREGRRAIRYLRACPPFRGLPVEALELAVFYAQSGVLYSSITSDEIRAVETEAKVADMGADGQELIDLVWQHRGLLNYARRRVLR